MENIASSFKLQVILLLSLLAFSGGWRALPANQAMYASRSSLAGIERNMQVDGMLTEEDLPRTFIHSVYKFGHCTPDSIKKEFLRESTNFTLPTWQDTQASYIYLIREKHTQRFRLQCIVMRIMVPRKYLFRRGRLPEYYCQGQLFEVFYETYNRYELHEFYFQQNLNMPANFEFDFYHATPL